MSLVRVKKHCYTHDFIGCGNITSVACTGQPISTQPHLSIPIFNELQTIPITSSSHVESLSSYNGVCPICNRPHSGRFCFIMCRDQCVNFFLFDLIWVYDSICLYMLAQLLIISQAQVLNLVQDIRNRASCLNII